MICFWQRSHEFGSSGSRKSDGSCGCLEWFYRSGKLVLPVISFLLRHFLFVAAAAVAGCVLWTVVYLVLLAFAVIANKGLGGPLAYPGGLLAVVVCCAVFGWGIFAPACGVGALICRTFRWPRIAAIPFVYLAAVGFGYLICAVHAGVDATRSMPSAWDVLKPFTLYLSVPLGIYWWLTDGPGALLQLAKRRFLARKMVKTRLG